MIDGIFAKGFRFYDGEVSSKKLLNRVGSENSSAAKSVSWPRE